MRNRSGHGLMSLSGEQQYLALCKGILQHGTWVENQRTGKKCLTIINADLTYDVGQGQFPLLTTRKCFYKSAIAELLGYLRGFDNAEQFRALGTKTWDANANDNRDWLANPARKGQDDCGMIYGKVARNFPKVGGGSIDLLHKVVQNLSQGVDDRAEIITFYHPGAFHLGCLRPCMYSHHFSLLGDTLHLTSYQRSCDVPLGLTFNMVQVHTLLALMAQITGHKPGKAYHKIVNAHVYEDQVEQLQAQVLRKPYAPPKLHINPDIKTLDDIESWVNLADFVLTDYQHHEAIRYAFAV